MLASLSQKMSFDGNEVGCSFELELMSEQFRSGMVLRTSARKKSSLGVQEG